VIIKFPNLQALETKEITMHDFPEFITKLPELDMPLEGVSGHLLQGDTQQVTFVRFDKDVEVPAHSHRAQWELVIAGEVKLTMKGEERTYRQGESFYVPEGIEHSGNVRAGYRAIIFFDQVDRYQAK
jgi:quercetin dioxygenase-like cupin family protein